jgi:ATP-dependent Lhr-like helicase
MDDFNNTVPSSLAWAHSPIREWLVGRFGLPTEPQELAWPPIISGPPTLISALTGSGKTLAAFLVWIDRLLHKALSGKPTDCTEVHYVSPLKALGNDVQKNLETPLGEILRLAAKRGLLLTQLRAQRAISEG